MNHVYPINDLIDHNLESPDCPCNPEIDFEHGIVIHAAMDRRECFEKKDEETK
jgi:hypothetical protein